MFPIGLLVRVDPLKLRLKPEPTDPTRYGVGIRRPYPDPYPMRCNLRGLNLTQPRPMFPSLVKPANPFNSLIGPLVKVGHFVVGAEPIPAAFCWGSADHHTKVAPYFIIQPPLVFV
jgi:hypothetical protein